ncbi:MAG: homoserine O-succinyltransferase [Clostridiales bacterium]|jgi:homoserine O-succinyltransferase|nr:homoserine O-succinyltransferase [Clostridiales bacterium]
MPVKLPKTLPAFNELEKENVFVMADDRATKQDIRPLKVVILNLMPAKEVTETQLLRMIANSPLQVEITLLRTTSYEPTNTSAAHLSSFYKTFGEVQHERFDGLIITGAPVERFDFTDVKYWDELTTIFGWADLNVFSTLYICWAAQAGLYYHHNIPKHSMPRKVSGIFEHTVASKTNPLLRGFDDRFRAPHSRHTEIRREDILKCRDLDVLAESDEAGVYLVANKNLRHVYVTGHGEYDADTLHLEYVRDRDKGLGVDMPQNYYVNDKVGDIPAVSWRSHAMLLINNWLNYCVYQQTPYDYII